MVMEAVAVPLNNCVFICFHEVVSRHAGVYLAGGSPPRAVYISSESGRLIISESMSSYNLFKFIVVCALDDVIVVVVVVLLFIYFCCVVVGSWFCLYVFVSV